MLQIEPNHMVFMRISRSSIRPKRIVWRNSGI
jgi:hypothetical protein